MNKQVRRLSIALLVCFTVLFVQLNVMQIVKADDYNSRADNTREIVRDFSRPRGQILSADGRILADSVPSGDKYDYLRGVPHGRPVRAGDGVLLVPLRHRGRRAAVQRRARRPHRRAAAAGPARLPRRRGPTSATSRSPCAPTSRPWRSRRWPAAPARSWRSTPAPAPSWPCTPTRRYDPNPLAAHDFDAVEAARQALLDRPGEPAAGEAPTRSATCPGSSFKVITTTAGLDTGTVTPDDRLPADRASTCRPAPRDPIENYGGTVCGGDAPRGVPAQLQHRLRPDGRGRRGRGHGAHGRGLRLQPHAADRHAPAGPELFPSVEDFRFDIPKLAQVELRPERQPDHAVEPGTGVGGGGQRRRDDGAPRAGRGARPATATCSQRYQPRPWQTATDDQATLAFLNQAMIEVVNNGTARCCMQLANGVQAAAKTGTAQLHRVIRPARTPGSRPSRRRAHRGWPSR